MLMVTEQDYASTGEWSSWAPEIEQRRVLLVASMRHDVHAALFRIMMISTGLASQGVESIELMVPLLPYARSDRSPARHAARGIDVFVAALGHAGIDRVITLDLHSLPTGEVANALRSIPSLDALIKSVRERGLRPLTVILPDEGALNRVGSDLPFKQVLSVKKQRFSDDNVSIRFEGDAKIEGSVLILDDALFTGATHSAVAEEALRLGATEVHLAVTHAMPQPHALELLARAGVTTLTHLMTTQWSGDHAQLNVQGFAWSERLQIESIK
jgi:ribose-phosphate pyrophosphokinase